MSCYRIEYISQKGWSTAILNFSSASMAIDYYQNMPAYIYWRKLLIMESKD